MHKLCSGLGTTVGSAARDEVPQSFPVKVAMRVKGRLWLSYKRTVGASGLLSLATAVKSTINTIHFISIKENVWRRGNLECLVHR